MKKIFLKLLCISFLMTFSITAAAATGSITGYKFHDLNGDGIDNGEPRLQNFKIVMQNVGGIPLAAATFTNAFGRFGFVNLPLQDYVVCEVVPVDPPWIPTTPQCVFVELSEKTRRAVVVFGNKLRGADEPGCTRTQGFWKSSPQGQALMSLLVPGTMLLGNSNYTVTQLNNIFDTPVGGNALLNLAHQLIAAKLNILAGASPNPVATTITNADTAIGALLIPPIGAAFVAPGSPLGMIMTSLAGDLDKYNNGLAGIPHCD